MHHVLIFELGVGSVVVDDGEEWHFVAEKADDVVVGGRVDVLHFFFQSIFFQDDHFVFEDVAVVLFE